WLIVSASSENATITISNSTLLYTTNNNFVGTDAITYIVQDQSGGTYPATATVTVHQSGADRTQGSAKITVNGVNDAPVISGESQVEIINTTITNPFSNISVTDVDNNGNELVTVSVYLNNEQQGILYYPQPNVFRKEGNRYIASGHAPEVATLLLKGLCFQPTPSGRVNQSKSESILINLSVFDGHSETVSDKTLVTVTHPPSSVILPFKLNGLPDSETGSEFGNAVAVSGKTMVIGSYLKDNNGIDSGGVYVYERGDGRAYNQWKVKDILMPEDIIKRDNFGESLDIDGEMIAVGASMKNEHGKKDSGAVYIYEKESKDSDGWVQTSKLTLPKELAKSGDQFGRAVSINEGNLFVGAPYYDANGKDSGAVFVFEKNPFVEGGWELTQTIIHDGDRMDWFGFSLDVDGTYAVVGAPGADRSKEVDGFELGAAYIFSNKNRVKGGWVLDDTLDLFDDPRASRGDGFGSSVAVDGISVVVGSFLFDASLRNGERVKDSGAAFVYERNNKEDLSWDLIDELFSQELHENEKFGTSVDINYRYLIVGKNSINANYPAGDVHLYERDISGTENWLFSGMLHPERDDTVSGFGSSVALGDNVAIIGASQDRESDLYERSGKVYVNYLELPGAFHSTDYVKDWINIHFDKDLIIRPSLERVLWGQSADPDNDSLTNAIELFFGTDPNSPDEGALFRITRNEKSLSMIYPRSKIIPEGFYGIEWSTNLKDWSNSGLAFKILEDKEGYHLIEASIDVKEAKSLYMRINLNNNK
ncbi:MAG: hypothetical protein EGP10_03275, partial [SAR202 cluster bacterium]